MMNQVRLASSQPSFNHYPPAKREERAIFARGSFERQRPNQRGNTIEKVGRKYIIIGKDF